MADVQYTVWRSAAEVANGPVLNENVVAIGAGSVQSDDVVWPGNGNRGCRVRLAADADCWVTWGKNPTAENDGTGGRRMGAENPEYFDILANEKIATRERT